MLLCQPAFNDLTMCITRLYLSHDAGTLTPIVKNPDAAFMSEQVNFGSSGLFMSDRLPHCCLCTRSFRAMTSVTFSVWLPLAHYLVQMRTAVRATACLFPTSIISGRGREKVQGFVKLKELFYAGSHGMDIVGPAVSSPPANMLPVSAAKYACSCLSACCCMHLHYMSHFTSRRHFN